MRVVVVLGLLAGCGRIGFSPSALEVRDARVEASDDGSSAHDDGRVDDLDASDDAADGEVAPDGSPSDAEDASDDVAIDGEGPRGSLVDGFDYASVSDAAFVATWTISTTEPGGFAEIRGGELVLEDVNQMLTMGDTTATTVDTFRGDYRVAVNVHAETACAGFAARGYAVVDIVMRGSDDPSQYVAWRMPWACTVSGNPPQRFYTPSGDVWTSGVKDEAVHIVELVRVGASITARADGVDRVVVPDTVGPFRLELHGGSAATFGYPAASFFDGVSITPL